MRSKNIFLSLFIVSFIFSNVTPALGTEKKPTANATKGADLDAPPKPKHLKKVRRAIQPPGRGPINVPLNPESDQDNTLIQNLDQWKAKRAREMQQDLPQVKKALNKNIDDLQREED